MSPVNPRRPRSSFGGPFKAILLVLGTLAVSFVAWIAIEGRVPDALADLPVFNRFAHAKAGAPLGKVAVPMSARAIKAYSRVARDDVWDPATNQITVVYLDPAKLGDDVVAEFAKIRGRVVAKDKAAGYVFSESDFLPEGTRAGLTAGIPAGKRGYRVALEKVPGLYGLNLGDRFDLMATLPIDTAKAQQQLQQLGGVMGRSVALSAGWSGAAKQASVHCVVQSGVIVSSVETRAVPYTITSLTQGAQAKTRPVQEVVIAIAPEEVAALEQALAVEAAISCVPRSGRPDDPAESKTPELSPHSPFLLGAGGQGVHLVETIKGTSRELVPVSGADAERGS